MHNINLISVVGCTTNRDCPTKQACNDRECVNPCEKSNPCKRDEKCDVLDHKPGCLPSEFSFFLSVVILVPLLFLLHLAMGYFHPFPLIMGTLSPLILSLPCYLPWFIFLTFSISMYLKPVSYCHFLFNISPDLLVSWCCVFNHYCWLVRCISDAKETSYL